VSFSRAADKSDVPVVVTKVGFLKKLLLRDGSGGGGGGGASADGGEGRWGAYRVEREPKPSAFRNRMRTHQACRASFLSAAAACGRNTHDCFCFKHAHVTLAIACLKRARNAVGTLAIAWLPKLPGRWVGLPF
jgi:hypothetical protein